MNVEQMRTLMPIIEADLAEGSQGLAYLNPTVVEGPPVLDGLTPFTYAVVGKGAVGPGRTYNHTVVLNDSGGVERQYKKIR